MLRVRVALLKNGLLVMGRKKSRGEASSSLRARPISDDELKWNYGMFWEILPRPAREDLLNYHVYYLQ